ncbi:MAG: RNA-processing protein [Candidatus Altiarchaeales archaeon]|nr:RNA-processing protein [Candidatus Altiarchaeales archaeon]MBD3415811.1 RNA-processing protein [Candidatus Altiarchaeales archaeon]
MQYVKIPEDRIAVLIGPKGATKRKLEKRCKCRIEVVDGDVSVEGDPLDEWVGKDIVQAIGRGFTPEKALQLLNDGHMIDFVDIEDYANTPKSRERLRGRVIGEAGRTRKHLERMTGTLICVYGNTVGVIGSYGGVALAKEAVEMLLTGKRHATVYRFMENQSRPER